MAQKQCHYHGTGYMGVFLSSQIALIFSKLLVLHGIFPNNIRSVGLSGLWHVVSMNKGYLVATSLQWLVRQAGGAVPI